MLLLDIDGPLNPYWAKEIPPGYERHEIKEGDKTWTLLLNQQHGTELNALAEIFDLVWATSWEHGANRLIAPRLGLPEDLPVIVWPAGAREAAVRRGWSWKTPYVAEWVGGRSFVWTDDEVNRRDRNWLLQRGSLGPHLLHRVEADWGVELGGCTGRSGDGRSAAARRWVTDGRRVDVGGVTEGWRLLSRGVWGEWAWEVAGGVWGLPRWSGWGDRRVVGE